MTVRILIGDVRARLAGMPDESVHCIVTSPPYWGLRSYDENAVRLDPALSPKESAKVLAELERRGIDAGL
jgi:DNA modification methylase